MSRTISRRSFMKAAGGAAATLALAACTPAAPPAAQGQAAPAPAATKVTIKALWSPGGIDAYMRQLIDLYKAVKPDVSFEITVVEQEQKRATEVTIMTNAGAPDFAWINYGSGLTDKLANAKAIVPLNDYYKKYAWWDFLPDHLHTHEYNGEMYHFSVASVTTPLMWYNKSLMAKVGLEPPKTMDEFYAWADACHKNDLEPLTMGDREGWPGFHMYQCIATRAVPLQDYEKILRFDKQEYNMKDFPGFQEAFQIMRDMEVKKAWAKGVLDMTNDEAAQLFLTGKAVAWETGVWAIGQMRKGLGDDLDFFLFPQVKPEITTPLTASYADEFLVSSYSKVKDEVAEFFNFVLSKDGQKIIAKLGSMPIRTDLTIAELGEVADPLTGKVVEMFGSKKYPVTDEIVTFWPAELYAMLRQNVQAVIGAQKTPEAVVTEFDELAAKFRAGAA